MTSEELLATIEDRGEDRGELLIEDCDDANIPVSIFLSEIEDSDREEAASAGEPYNPNHRWVLRADNYMPRKGRASESAYEITAPTREALVEVIKKFIIPLYQIALANLEGIIAGTNDSLYYWTSPKEKQDG